MTGCEFGWKTPSRRATRKQNEQKDRLSLHVDNNNHNRFSTFEDDDEEDEKVSEVSVSTSVVSDVINNRRQSKRTSK